mgnify:CR=1 FL=1
MFGRNSMRFTPPGPTVAMGPSGALSSLNNFNAAPIQRNYASGGLAKLVSYMSPDLGQIYNESVEFGKKFPGASEDGMGDAARHAYAASRIARKYGPTTAQLLGNLYEMTSLGADRRSTRMDEFNNETGISLADLEDAAVRQRIGEMLRDRSNKLRYFDKANAPDSGYATGGLVQNEGPSAVRDFLAL